MPSPDQNQRCVANEGGVESKMEGMEGMQQRASPTTVQDMPIHTERPTSVGGNTGTGLGKEASFLSMETPLACNDKSCQLHEPPPGVDYSENESVFGEILRGEAPAIVLDESERVLVFCDRNPRAPLHGLVIPKRFIKSVFALQPDDLSVLDEMIEMGQDTVKRLYPEAYRENNYILCFHVPPFNSVDHLHLHVLAPATQMSPIYRFGKYLTGIPVRWCASAESVRQRVAAGKKAVPYRYHDN